ncbi:transposase [Streptomyces sp. NPDC001185]|uniref:transposase n=1 Tax=Streptomyces sp. NPDC001185 TaxID=3154380 RepID=UPI0033182B68
MRTRCLATRRACGDPRTVQHWKPRLRNANKVSNALKGVFARLLRKEYDTQVRRYLWGGHFWYGSYFTRSCGGAPMTVVQQYIERHKRPVG